MTLLAQFAATGGAGAANYIEDVFQTWLYTGNGSTQTITNGIDLAGKGGLVWTKARPAPIGHGLVDTARGGTKLLQSNTTAAEDTFSGYITSFNANGYTLGASGVLNDTYNMVSWTFRRQPKFFDVVTYTGNGTSGRTVAHNLGSVPGCMIVKKTNSTGQWCVYHRGLTTPATGVVFLNLTNAQTTDPNVWNSTAPTSTVFTLGNSTGVNNNGDTYVAYLFAHNAGGFGLTGTDNVISCGSYTGNGSSASQTINLGYEPQWVMVKAASSGGVNYDWIINDTMRGLLAPDNAGRSLFANSVATEFTQSTVSITSTGFTPIGVSSNSNESGVTYIYIAIRRGPMKVPTTGTSVFSVQTYTGDDSTRTLTTGFPVDLAIGSSLVSSAGNSASFSTRLTGTNRYMNTSSTGAEVVGGNSLTGFDIQTGVGVNGPSNGAYNFGSTPYVLPALRRAPGFFDVVCYTGDGVNGRTVSHNLTVAPELIIVKSRSASADWAVYANGPVGCLILNATNAANGIANFPVGTPTTTTFAVASSSGVNGSGITFVAHLFATCPGVSKVGSYTGTATTQVINCGFTGGARFVMIKRTDSTGDWYVWDSARGIVAGNDPYLLWNVNGNQVTSTDYVDTAASGFELTATAPAAINASGGTFIFWAIA